MSQVKTYGYAYIEQFQCLADQCEHHCCSGWRVALNDERVELYQQDYPELYELIARDEGGYHMRRGDAACIAYCDGLCSIHRDYGESLLSNTCIDYPRMYRAITDFYTRAGTMSCPEIARKCLFDADPFALVPTQLPDNHRHGEGLVPLRIDNLDEQLWHQVMSAMFDAVNHGHNGIEQTLLMVSSLAHQLAQSPTDTWPVLIAEVTQCSYGQQREADGDRAEGENELATHMAKLLLEHIDHPTAPNYLRQRVLAAFRPWHHDSSEPLLVALLSGYKSYYQRHQTGWIRHVLKRFMVAEMTRIGFPFLSITPAGKDYGETLAEWGTTLCIRVLSLRLLLVILAASATMEENHQPGQNVVSEWVYQFCRRTNHLQSGPCERQLRQLLLSGERLSDYVGFNRM